MVIGVLGLFFSCGKDSNPVATTDDNGSGTDDDITKSVAEVLAQNCPDHESADDYTWTAEKYNP